jgi:hypothetical protein
MRRDIGPQSLEFGAIVGGQLRLRLRCAGISIIGGHDGSYPSGPIGTTQN